MAADPHTDPNAAMVTTVPCIDGSVTGEGRQHAEHSGLRRHAQQAAGGAAGDGGRRIGHHGQRQPAATSSTPSFGAEPVGTLFLPHNSTLPAWKRWLGYTARPRGRLVVDAGARQAVQTQGRSLLPIGVVQVVGHVRQGRCGVAVRPRRRGVRARPDELRFDGGGSAARLALGTDSRSARRVSL